MNQPSVCPGLGQTDIDKCRTTHGPRPAPQPPLGAHVQAPRAPPTPNLHQKARRASERRQVTSLLPPHRPPTASQPPDGPRCPARTEARGNREIRTYGFIYQSAAAGHTATELPAPPPSQPPQGGARPGCRRLGCLAVDQVKLTNQLTRKAGGGGKAGRGRAVSLVPPVPRYRGP